MKTVTAINQKGGVGKTTTALATAHGLAARGNRVLFVDLDPQQNASSVLKAKGATPTSYDVMARQADPEEAIFKAADMDVMAADPRAVQADIAIEGIGKEYRLKEALQGLQSAYDYCIIDTPPALGVLTTNALTAADAAVIPAQADIFSLEGIGQLAGTIGAVRKYANPRLTIAGILLTRYNRRTTLSREIRQAAEEAATALDTVVFEATIREAVAVKEAQAMKESIFEYAPKTQVAKDFESYVTELQGRL